MRRNNSPLNYKNSHTSKKSEKKEFNMDRIKLDIPSITSLVNNYKNHRYTNFLNSDLKLNNTNSLYNQINYNSQKKELFSSQIKSNNKAKLKKSNINFVKKEVSNIKLDLINQKSNNNSKNNNENINENIIENNNIYNDDTDRSSMETIKKILYSTGNRKERKKNELLKNTQSNLNDIFYPNYTINQKREGNLTPLNLNNNKIGSRYLKIINMPNGNKTSNKNLFYRLNKKLVLNKRNGALNSMKSLKTNNYIFNNNNSSANDTDEIKNKIEEKNKILNNNLNINISNNNKSTNENKINNNKFAFINYTSRYDNKNKNILDNLGINLNNGLYNYKENKKSRNIEPEKNDEIHFLKEKIKKLTEEIKTKDLLINEYSSLAKESKAKFKQLLIHNKTNIEKIKNESKREIMIYKSKLMSVEKEKKNILNKYLENRKYIEVLENILFENVNLNNSDNNSNNDYNNEENKIKNYEQVIKKLMNDISRMKIEIKNINKDNEKIKNIVLKYKNNKNYRAISNPRRNASTIDQIRKINFNSNVFDIKEIPSLNLSQKSKNPYK